MFLRRTERKKDGKTHTYWNIVESKRLDDGRVVQRHVLYLGEINSSQADAWRKAIEVFDEDAGRPRTLALFPAGRDEAVAGDAMVVQVRLSDLTLHRPRQWGACWLAGQLWRDLALDRFWADRLPASRKGTRWDQILQVLVSYRLIAPGSEWKLHRDWFGRSAMADVLGADFGLAQAHKLYACHDRLLEHKEALFSHLVGRWRTLFSVDFDVLLYDLTSTYFEINAADVPEGDKRRHGYSRDKRPDCPQVVIALVVTPEGLPLAYEVLPGNTADSKTLRTFLNRIEAQYGKARRVWVMDRGIPSEAVLAEMRGSDPPVQYLVGTPKGRLTRLEKHLADKPWQDARAGVRVKLLARDNELYVFAQSADRVTKERAMRRRQLKWLWKRLGQLAAMEISREEMLMKLGAARAKAPTAWRLVEIEMDKDSSMFIFTLNRKTLRTVRRREGRYLLRTNLTGNDPAMLWQYYIQLVAVEEAFKNLKGDLAIRPIFHRDERRIEAHIFIAFLAYCLYITLHRRLHALAPGLTARSVLEKFAAVQMIDVHVPTTDGRELVLTRYTQPEPELQLLIQQLKLRLPP
ncbi:IS1634 family transposase, partial [Bradyrhizobium sp.]|uniref:IS1634 family transposase n=1 Tax=Bradyrhizobium sp. TaxID=376 RepID=UPI002DFD821D|nr:IS1634 family transposase [Bradyrhizobium sp.]